jgi:hypothetical protein
LSSLLFVDLIASALHFFLSLRWQLLWIGSKTNGL